MFPALLTLLRKHFDSRGRRGRWDITAPPSGVLLHPDTLSAVRDISAGKVFDPRYAASLSEWVTASTNVEVSRQFIEDVGRLKEGSDKIIGSHVLKVVAALLRDASVPGPFSDQPLNGEWRVCSLPGKWELVYRKHRGRIQLARIALIDGSGRSRLYDRVELC